MPLLILVLLYGCGLIVLWSLAWPYCFGVVVRFLSLYSLVSLTFRFTAATSVGSLCRGVSHTGCVPYITHPYTTHWSGASDAHGMCATHHALAVEPSIYTGCVPHTTQLAVEPSICTREVHHTLHTGCRAFNVHGMCTTHYTLTVEPSMFTGCAPHTTHWLASL